MFRPETQLFINWVRGGAWPMSDSECFEYLDCEELQSVKEYCETYGIEFDEETALNVYSEALNYFEDCAVEAEYC